MRIFVAGNGATVLELIRYFIVKWGHDVTVANGDEDVAKGLELLNKCDAVVMCTSTIMKHFRNGSRFTLPSIMCSSLLDLKVHVEEFGGIFVDNGSRNFVNELRAALDKIAAGIAKEKE